MNERLRKRLNGQLQWLVSNAASRVKPGPARLAVVWETVNGGNRTVPTLVFADGTAMTNPSIKQVVEKVGAVG